MYNKIKCADWSTLAFKFEGDVNILDRLNCHHRQT